MQCISAVHSACIFICTNIELARLIYANKTDNQYHTSQNIADLAVNVML